MPIVQQEGLDRRHARDYEKAMRRALKLADIEKRRWEQRRQQRLQDESSSHETSSESESDRSNLRERSPELGKPRVRELSPELGTRLRRSRRSRNPQPRYRDDIEFEFEEDNIKENEVDDPEFAEDEIEIGETSEYTLTEDERVEDELDEEELLRENEMEVDEITDQGHENNEIIPFRRRRPRAIYRIPDSEDSLGETGTSLLQDEEQSGKEDMDTGDELEMRTLELSPGMGEASTPELDASWNDYNTISSAFSISGESSPQTPEAILSPRPRLSLKRDRSEGKCMQPQQPSRSPSCSLVPSTSPPLSPKRQKLSTSTFCQGSFSLALQPPSPISRPLNSNILSSPTTTPVFSLRNVKETCETFVRASQALEREPLDEFEQATLEVHTKALSDLVQNVQFEEFLCREEKILTKDVPSRQKVEMLAWNVNECMATVCASLKDASVVWRFFHRGKTLRELQSS